jgi:UDP-N-acetyl-D-mannosaminuronate dehydrogenase
MHGDPDATVVAASREANKLMPKHAVDLLQNGLGDMQEKRVVILGLSYRGGVKEHAFSGTWDLISEIQARGGVPLVHDPMYEPDEIRELGIMPFELNDPCDGIIMQADHIEYRDLVSENFPGALFMVDGRNCANQNLREALPFSVIGVGRPN